MADKDNEQEFTVEKGEQNTVAEKPSNEGKVIDEANYRVRAKKESGPTAVGRGGDPLFRRINATREQLIELMEETQTIQDWVQRETSNNVAISCLDNENLKEIYFEIKDGFGEYGRISLMGFKTPTGVEIPRLKIYDTNGEVIEVLTGPMAIDELNKRAIVYKKTVQGYEAIEQIEDADVQQMVIEDYSGNPSDYIS